MKIMIINIEDRAYAEIKEDTEKFRSKGMVIPYLYKVIETGIPLSIQELGQDPILYKIRAEIISKPFGVASDAVLNDMKYERQSVLEIIDKYITQESEEEEDDCTDIYCEKCRNNYNCIEYLEEQERINEEEDDE